MKPVRAVFAAAAGTLLLASCAVLFPRKELTSDIRTLDQGWSDADRAFFYRASQGTFSVPLAWLEALEQPGKGERPLFREPEYMSRMGFMYGASGDGPGAGLPIGFAVTDDPETGAPFVGFTCAACHTGQLNYVDKNDGKLKALRVDGGASLHALDKYREALVAALMQTHLEPERLARFAGRVLGKEASPGQREALRLAVKKAVEKGFKTGLVEAVADIYPVTEGYGRLDALQRISNTVFGYDLENVHNLRPGNGPVSYPHLWDVWRLDWVQWNGSVRQPMARNVGEALGVSAGLNLTDRTRLFDSTVPVRTLSKIEETLKRLKPPVWPEDIWPADAEKAAQGKALFVERCASCHGTKRIKGTEEWRVSMLSVKQIGTDPTAAENFMRYAVDASAIGASKATGQAEGLQFITEKVIKNRYKAEGVTKEEAPEIDGEGRRNVVRAPCGYKARPLHGVWATAPFLHNGAAPDLYALLSPPAERPERFDVGSHMFDPVKVGLATEVRNGTTIDARIKGNFNAGHAFDDAPGSIGPKLTEEERYALIEFLKIHRPGDLPEEEVARTESYPCRDVSPTFGP
jgi:hypothetical protein